MKNLTSFFQLFVIAILCFANNVASAQIQAMPNSVLTPIQYNSAEIAGYGANTVVLFKKPNVANVYVLASYGVSTSGAVTLKDSEELYSATAPAMTKLSESRMVIVTNGTENVTARIYDINTTSGDFTAKGTRLLALAYLIPQAVVRLSGSSSFGVAVVGGGTIQLYSLVVNSAGTTVTLKDDDVYELANIQGIKLARMSNSRFVASTRMADNTTRLICYGVNETNGAISRYSSYQLAGSVQRITMSAFATDKLACFTNDMNNNLDVTTLQISSIGTFTLKNQYQDLKMPGTSNNYQIANMDCQYDSGVSKIHLFATRTTDKLNVIPFTFNSTGALTQDASGHYLSPVNYISTSVSAASGYMVAASRITDGKVRIQAFKWGN